MRRHIHFREAQRKSLRRADISRAEAGPIFTYGLCGNIYPQPETPVHRGDDADDDKNEQPIPALFRDFSYALAVTAQAQNR